MNALISKISLLLLVFTLVACEPQQGNIQFSNPTDEISIDISAKRESAIDPWNTTISVKPFEREGVRLGVEVFVSDFTNENVEMNWESDYSGILTFIQSDNTKRRFKLKVDDKTTKLSELKEQPSF